MPSKDRNHHNPSINEADLRRLSDLRWSKRMTWRQFYEWACPVLEREVEREKDAALAGHEGTDDQQQ